MHVTVIMAFKSLRVEDLKLSYPSSIVCEDGQGLCPSSERFMYTYIQDAFF